MYPDLPTWGAVLMVAAGLAILAWSADAFVAAAAKIARAFGVSPFIVGMVIIGFGTSAPELCVSALSGASGHSNLSLGNAFGSDVFNIACILGVAALIRPLSVKPAVTFAAAPVMAAVTVFSALLVGFGGGFSRTDGIILLAVFAVLLPVYCWFDQRGRPKENDAGTQDGGRGLVWSFAMLIVGLAALVGSSHLLVWGCVDVARSFGISELVIGLTIVAVGTSLPELASAVASARRGESEFVLGNIIGSNFFNTLGVVGLAGAISPFKNISPYIMQRDLPVLVLLSLSIMFFGANFRSLRSPGAIGRVKGSVWILSFVAYTAFMLFQELR